MVGAFGTSARVPPDATVARRDAPVLAGGIDVGEPDASVFAAGLRAHGLGMMQVTHYALQGEWDSATLRFPEGDPEVLARPIRAARDAGLDVMVVLRVDMDRSLPRNRHTWHGMIWPRDDALDAWFRRYEAYVSWAARIAEREGAAALVIGNELNALAGTRARGATPAVLRQAVSARALDWQADMLRDCVQRYPALATEAFDWHDGGRYSGLDAAIAGQRRALGAWADAVAGSPPDESRLRRRAREHEAGFRRVARAARSIFSGFVTYGAGFDTYAEVGFWDALDGVGLTGYFSLRGDQERQPPYSARWRESLEGVSHVASGAPVYFVELGFTRARGAAVRPWSYEGLEVLPAALDGRDIAYRCVCWDREPVAEEERVAALSGLRAALDAGALPELRGFSMWKLTTLPEHRRIEPYAALLPGRAPVPEADQRYLDEVSELARLLEARSP